MIAIHRRVEVGRIIRMGNCVVKIHTVNAMNRNQLAVIQRGFFYFNRFVSTDLRFEMILAVSSNFLLHKT